MKKPALNKGNKPGIARIWTSVGIKYLTKEEISLDKICKYTKGRKAHAL